MKYIDTVTILRVSLWIIICINTVVSPGNLSWGSSCRGWFRRGAFRTVQNKRIRRRRWRRGEDATLPNKTEEKMPSPSFPPSVHRYSRANFFLFFFYLIFFFFVYANRTVCFRMIILCKRTKFDRELCVRV